MSEEKVSFKNKKGKKIVGILHTPKKEHIHHKIPCVIICHGFTGFKEETHLVNLSKELEDYDIASLRCDFTNSGESEGSWEGLKTSEEIEDLKSIIDYVEQIDFVDKNKIGVAGHSLGGLVSIITASQDFRIKVLVTLAAVDDPKEKSIVWVKDMEKWKQIGYHIFSNIKYIKIKIGYGFWTDLKKFSNSTNIKKVKVPLLILHGDKDKVVPLSHGEKIYKNANEPKLLRIIEGANHLFSGKAILALTVKYAVDWFAKYLK
ncbi:MAG: alpha/beta hydrolase [Candidatus Nanoarchaeia archaeon]|jgi:hypothetical protein|nr:alpha/beta hydrolase [Candidatus Nanoarchaeia archaeon]|tara:strand:- start:21662 stop:22444 length:783 start_codon:yes stop_codon:yes gene_type:complete